MSGLLGILLDENNQFLAGSFRLVTPSNPSLSLHNPPTNQLGHIHWRCRDRWWVMAMADGGLGSGSGLRSFFKPIPRDTQDGLANQPAATVAALGSAATAMATANDADADADAATYAGGGTATPAQVPAPPAPTPPSWHRAHLRRAQAC